MLFTLDHFWTLEVHPKTSTFNLSVCLIESLSDDNCIHRYLIKIFLVKKNCYIDFLVIISEHENLEILMEKMMTSFVVYNVSIKKIIHLRGTKHIFYIHFVYQIPFIVWSCEFLYILVHLDLIFIICRLFCCFQLWILFSNDYFWNYRPLFKTVRFVLWSIHF